MQIVLAGISAKFIHPTLSIHLLSHYAKQYYDIDSRIAEFTINQYDEYILSEIFRLQPDLLGFSCYIWNYGIIRRLIPTLRKILPQTRIFVGGPEVSYDALAALQETGADFVLSGEGEEPFSRLCLAMLHNTPLSEVPSLSWMDNGKLCQNPLAAPLDLGKLPFIYEHPEDFKNRILYYEAQRGCPFNCQYCLSSIDKGVRFQPLEKVLKELQFLLDAKVPQVKFVDRTFNTSARYAMSVWTYLAEHDNGITNFHFEMEADLITEEQLDFLETIRPGLFQFEIGVQSINSRTLQAVDRHTDLNKLARISTRLRNSRCMHLHLDLIAGLPYEDYESFRKSFDWVYALHPDQLQLGFLKLLKGSGLRRNADKYGLIWHNDPPYEILSTDVLPYADVLRLKDIEALNELYYNSARFQKSLAYLVSLGESPFTFFESFACWYRQRGSFLVPHTKLEQYELLRQFGLTLSGCDEELLGWKMRYDLYSHEKCRKIPDWLPGLDSPELREKRRAFFFDPAMREKFLPEYAGLDPKQVEKMAHLDFFPAETGDSSQTECILFNYRCPDLLGRATVFYPEL